MTRISFRIPVAPKGQPRPRYTARNRKDGSAFAHSYQPKSAAEHKALITQHAFDHSPPSPLEGPVSLDVTFYMPRPKAHFRTGKRAGELKPNAPTWSTGKPDRDNLDKALLDGLTNAGFFRDDCQVCAGEILKKFHEPKDVPHIRVTIAAL